MASYEGSPSEDALVALSRAVSDRSNHAAIARDPEGELARLGVSLDELPPGAREALSNLSEDDLEQVAAANQRLMDFGFKVDAEGGSAGYL
jgi:hypothetical protein